MTKLELYENDKHRATLSFHEHLSVYEVADQLRLLTLIMGFTHEQAHYILPDDLDVEKFVDELREEWGVSEK